MGKDRSFTMHIPIGKADNKNTIISKNCRISLPDTFNPVIYGFDHRSVVGRWKAKKTDDSIEVDIELHQELPKALEQVFNTLEPWGALDFPFGFRPIKSRDDDGITYFDEIELIDVRVAIKPPPAAVGVFNAELMKDWARPVPIRELTKDLEVTFDEHKLTARKITVSLHSDEEE